MATWKSFTLLDAISPLMEQLSFFHDHTMLILLMILSMVAYIMATMMKNKYINKTLLEGQLIEIIWTILPTVTLIFIATPSLNLLYLIDEINSPSLTVKTIGHQWYWSYEMTDFLKKEIDSYMKPINELKKSSFRLLDVDNQLVLPFKSKIRMMFTSTDVIHSWTIQSLGTKMDATPGRLNQIMFLIKTPGLFFGQCSEICGMNHSFMPTSIESVSPSKFINWIKIM
uniref:Cytochrome c oxidase subunit 2 n=10 Tax=Lycinae TaxID=2043423 RepID=A0A888YND4_9COLE|nr:cytochrome c oxidase subunit II [Lycostomus sp. YXY-2021]